MQPARQLRRQRSGRVIEADAPAAARLRRTQELEVDAPLGLLPGWKGAVRKRQAPLLERRGYMRHGGGSRSGTSVERAAAPGWSRPSQI